MSSNIEIEEKMKKIKNFKGCFPIDLIPKLNKKESLIINSDKHDEEGTHWMGLKITSKNVCLFFDSFGEPPNKYITDFLSRYYRKLVYNSIQVQSVFSNKCGEFSMQFICVVNDRTSFNNFISKFDHTNLLANDKITENFLVNYLNKYKK